MLKKINVATVLQALKTGVAGTVAFYLSGLFHLPQGYWATKSAFIVLQGDATSTVSASRDRLIGTAIGAFTGAVFVRFVGVGPLRAGFAAVITILLCKVLGTDTSYRIACVTAVLVMYVKAPGTPWMLG